MGLALTPVDARARNVNFLSSPIVSVTRTPTAWYGVGGGLGGRGGGFGKGGGDGGGRGCGGGEGGADHLPLVHHGGG